MGRTALVTGAASGIGKATALRLGREGLAIGVLDLDLEGCEQVAEEIRAAGGQAIALRASIANRAQMATALDALRTAFGPVTVLVNNAGISEMCAFEELTDAAWDRMMEINLKGTFIATQTCLPDMKTAGWGRIVNISSSSAQTGAVHMAHYSASKGAVIALTRTLAQELGPLGITVNTIPPGSVQDTRMYNANVDTTPAAVAQRASNNPVRRLGIPDDIANAVAWLVSDASSYVTGQTIGVNGGRIV